MNNFWKNFPVISLLGAIMIFRSFIFGSTSIKAIELRVEDFLLLFFGSIFIIRFFVIGKYKIQKPPLFNIISLWLLIGFFGLLLNIILGNLVFADTAIFYFLKVVELVFLYFFVFYSLKDIDSIKLVIKFVFFFSVLNVLYIFYQVISNRQAGEYGTAALSERGVFPTGAFFLLLFIFLSTFFIFYYNNLKKKLWEKASFGILAISPALGAIGSASKTIVLSLLFCSVAIIALALWGRKIKIIKILIISFLAIIILYILFVFSINYIRFESRIADIFTGFSNFSIFTGFSNLYSSYSTDRLLNNLDLFIKTTNEFSRQPFTSLFGFGVGYITEAHNQFLRNFAEIGIIGSIIFLVMMYLIFKYGIKAYFRNKDPLAVFAGASIVILTLAMLSFCLTTDPFFSVKTSSIYWFLLAVNASIISITTRNKSIEA